MKQRRSIKIINIIAILTPLVFIAALFLFSTFKQPADPLPEGIAGDWCIDKGTLMNAPDGNLKAICIAGKAEKIYIRLPGPALAVGTESAFRVWLPEDAPLSHLLLFVQDAEWGWNGVLHNYEDLKTGDWNNLGLEIPREALRPLKMGGLELTTSGPGEIILYIDPVDWKQKSSGGTNNLKKFLPFILIAGFAVLYYVTTIQVKGSKKRIKTFTLRDPGRHVDEEK